MYGITDLISYALMVADEMTGEEPESYKQAMNSRDKLKWLSAMEEEMASLKKYNTWVLVQRPAGRRLVGCKRIFKLKEGVAGSESVRSEYDSLFEMKDLGSAAKILGMQIKRDRCAKTLFITQSGYLKRVVSRFGMVNSNPVTTPVVAHFKLSKQQEPEEEADIDHIRRISYSSAVGSIMYAMVCTRPDVANGFGLVSRFMGNPGKEHWEAAKWLLRYLKGTEEYGVVFGQVNNASSKVLGYVDSNFVGDLDKRRSVTSFVFTLCGGAVSWKSTLQSVVTLSTTEAEYIALTEAVKEAIWLKGLVTELGLEQESVIVNCDSSSAIQLSKNPKYHKRTKHVDVRMHFIREEIRSDSNKALALLFLIVDVGTHGLDAALEVDEDSKAKKGKEEGSSSSGKNMKTINNKAHSTIILHLSDEVLKEVSKERTTSGLWEKLEELFLKKSLAKKLYMKRKLYTFSMKDGTSLKDHVDEFNKLILDLENVNIVLEDEDRALILFSSLLDFYEHFVDILLYGRQALTLKDVKNALESKDMKRITDGKDQNPAESLFVITKPDKKVNKDKKNSNQKDKADKKKKKRKCYFYNKKGHYIKDCFEKKKLEKLQKESNGKAVITSEDEGMSDDADVLIAAEKQSSGEWILDSDCSFHMCPNIDFFKTFESIDGGKVLLRNNLACKVAGIGTISIRIFDGIERDLKEVRYVPELKRNLISLGLMDQGGCSIKAGNGNLQIEENGLIIMKGIKRNGLYVLVGSITMPAITASVSSDKTKLWHMMLAHMSERGLKELSKQGLPGNDQITSLQFCENVCLGSSQVPSHGGARNFITFIDDYSRRVWVYVLKHKSETFGRFKEWTALMETQIEKRLKRLRTDNGLEFCNSDFENFCKSKGIARHRTIRHTPRQNGLAERINRTLIEKAMNNRDKLKWLSAMEEEMASLKKNNTWVLVQRPTGRRLVGCKRIFKLKKGVAGSESVRYKARLVAKLFTQKEGIDFNEMDVKTAFLHGNLEEEILMAQLEGFIEEGTKDMVCLLKKNLYGLKQSPQQCVVGSIMYAMVCTRPNVAYGIGLVSRFMGNPGKEH
ncbi:hypothetical protein KPL70_021191 [Citrus sinensis]|nr:hypothetical protein KPL70_021191 [Citrus sinensis]